MRIRPIALGFVASTMMITPAFAQDKFPDVPLNHWAYEALDQLKSNGLVHGYPDKTFRGPRSFTRYEMAVMIHEAWLNLQKHKEDLGAKLLEMDKKLADGKDASTADLRSALQELKSGLSSVQALQPDIDSLKKLVAGFEPELTQVGVKVEEIKKSLESLSSRVSKLEKDALPVQISGQIDTVSTGGYSDKGDYGVDSSGRPLGTGRGAYAKQPVGAFRSLTMLHEFALTLKSNEGAKIPFKATIVEGNMLGFASKAAAGAGFSFGGFTSQSSSSSGVAWGESPEAIYVQELNATLKKKLLSLNLGRVGLQSNPYVLRRPDKTPFFANERWDNGDYMLDGAVLANKFKKFDARFFVGRTNENAATNGFPIQTLAFGRTAFQAVPGAARPIGTQQGSVSVDQLFGADVKYGKKPFSADASFIHFDSNNAAGNATNNGNAYGTTLKLGDKKGAVQLVGSYAKSDLYNNKTSVVTKQNDAYWLTALGKVGAVNAKVGYQYINPLFFTPGDWGKIGIWRNPADVKGVTGSLSWDFADGVTLSGGGQALTGTGKTVGGATGLSTSDKIQAVNLNLSKRLSDRWQVGVGYDSVLWNLQNRTGFVGGKPEERWRTVSLKEITDSGRVFSIVWQVSDYNSKSVAGFALPYNGAQSTTGGVQGRGGLITIQLSSPF